MPLQALQGAKCCKGGIQNETDPKRVRSTIMNRSFLNMHAVTETTEMCGKGATLGEMASKKGHRGYTGLE